MNPETIFQLIISLSFGIAISVIITPIYIFIRKNSFAMFTNEKLLKKAIDNGNVVQAKLIKSYENTDSSMEKIGIYEYEYNGKKYKTQGSSSMELPENTKLYFIKNPRKAVDAKKLFLTAKSPWISSFFIITIFISFIIFLILSSNVMTPNELMNSIVNCIK